MTASAIRETIFSQLAKRATRMLASGVFKQLWTSEISYNYSNYMNIN